MPGLNWEEAGTVTVGNIVGQINRAPLGQGNVFHSIKICRKDESGKMAHFIRVDDLKNMEEFVKKVNSWIQQDIETIRKAG